MVHQSFVLYGDYYIVTNNSNIIFKADTYSL